jgi:hypothetical protein
MANTINADLIVDSVSSQAQTVLANRLAALRLFSTDFSNDVKRPKDVVQVPIATAGSTTLTNPTAFNSIGASTLGKTTVTLDHLYQPFGLEYVDLQNAIRLENITKVNLDKIADAIWAAATAPITVANFGAATVTAADSAVTPTSGDLATLWAGVSKAQRKGLVVNAGIYSSLIPTNSLGLNLAAGAYGFEEGVFYASSFPSEAKLAGFAVSKEAVAIASAKPAMAGFEGQMVAQQEIALADLGLSIYFNLWADMATRSHIASFEVMFGSAKAVTTGTLASVYNP